MTDQPWTRQEIDTDKSYAAFCIYRDMGPDRSLGKVWQNDGKTTVRNLEKWSSSHNWVERVQAYDKHIQEEVRKQNEALIFQIGTQALQDLKTLMNVSIDQVSEFDGFGLRPKAFEDMPEDSTKAIKKIEFQKGQGAKIELESRLAIIREGLKLAGLSADKVKHEVEVSGELSMHDIANMFNFDKDNP